MPNTDNVNQKAKDIVSFLLTQAMALFIAQTLIRLFGIYFTYKINAKLIIYLLDLIIGIGMDILLISSLLLPIYLLLRVAPNIFHKLLRGSVRGFFLLLIVVSFLLESYFSVQLVPLGSVLLSYDFGEIVEISNKNSDMGIFEYISLIVILISYITLSYRKLIDINIKVWQFVIGSIASAILAIGLISYTSNLVNIFSYFTRSNKIYYLAESIYESSNKQPKKDDILSQKYVDTFHKLMVDRRFTDKEYPLQHIADTADILGSFVQKGAKPPNFVFIIVESLSRTISGPNALHGSYTPYLDSLAQNSLYWENYISASERTIGVLPSLLGSLPLSNNGFMGMKGKMPKHYSLISLLRYNGYKSRFFYGGGLSFDNYGGFLSEQQIDFIQSGDFYSNNGKSFWGLSDSLVYSKSIEALRGDTAQAFINVYLTLSTHGPYDYDVYKYYEQDFENHLTNNIPKDKQQYGHKHKKKLLSYLYTDLQIKKLINDYKKLGIYDNTIFIITGDHGLFALDKTNALQRYHIPLIIHSPLINKAQSFKGIASHYDVAPTIFSFLKNTHNMDLPQQVHFIGSVIDTSRIFCGTKNFVPILEISRNMTDFVYHNTFYTNGKVFDISDNLVISKSLNANIDSLSNYLQSYKNIDYYVTSNNKLIRHSHNPYISLNILVKDFTRKRWPMSDQETFTTIEDFTTTTDKSHYEIDLSFDFYTEEVSIKKHPSIVVAISTIKDNKTLARYAKDITDSTYCAEKTRMQVSLATKNIQQAQIEPISIKVYFWNSGNIIYDIKNLEYKRYKSL